MRPFAAKGMFCVRIDRLWASTGVRLALVNAVILTAAFGAAVYGARWITHRDMREAQDRRIRAEVAALLDERKVEGREAFLHEMVRRKEGAGMLFRWVAPDGIVGVDDFAGAPLALGWSSLDWDRPGDAHHVKADIDVLSIDVDGGGRLSVGATRTTEERVRESLVRNLYLTGVLATATAILASALLTHNTFRRVNDLAGERRRKKSKGEPLRRLRARGCEHSGQRAAEI